MLQIKAIRAAIVVMLKNYDEGDRAISSKADSVFIINVKRKKLRCERKTTTQNSGTITNYQTLHTITFVFFCSIFAEVNLDPHQHW